MMKMGEIWKQINDLIITGPRQQFFGKKKNV